MRRIEKSAGPTNYPGRSFVPLSGKELRRLSSAAAGDLAPSGALPYEDQGRTAMKRRLTALALAVPLCLGGLALVLTARSDDTPSSPAAPPPKSASSHVTHVTV